MVNPLIYALAAAYVVLGCIFLFIPTLDILGIVRQNILAAILIVYGLVRFYRIFRNKNG